MPVGLTPRFRVQPLLQKYSGFPKTQISNISFAVPSRKRGARAIVTDAGRDAVDAECAADDRRMRGRRSRVVLMSRRRHQVCKSLASDGDKKADHRGERDISRKPLCRESRMQPVTCGPTPVLFLHGTHGCIGHPAFPAPSVFPEGQTSCIIRTPRVAETNTHARSCFEKSHDQEC